MVATRKAEQPRPRLPMVQDLLREDLLRKIRSAEHPLRKDLFRGIPFRKTRSAEPTPQSLLRNNPLRRT
eukprot:13018332-Alexandrium_andersonii.AAC.1